MVFDRSVALSYLWVWLSIGLYLSAFAVSRLVRMPSHRRTNLLLAEFDANDGQSAGRTRRAVAARLLCGSAVSTPGIPVGHLG